MDLTAVMLDQLLRVGLYVAVSTAVACGVVSLFVGAGYTIWRAYLR